MEKVLCNYCSSKSFTVFLEDAFTLVRCKKCGLIYLNPRPDEKSIGKYYSGGNYWSGATDSDKAYGHIYSLIFKSVSTGSVLDIGAGTGLFLNGFKKRGWEIHGVELSPKAASIAKKKFMINLKKGDLLDMKLSKNTFDLVTLNNVLEHLHNPLGTLTVANKLLKKDGRLMISAPNIDSMGANIFKKNWYGIDAPRHLYQFSYPTLNRMLKKAGFQVTKIDYSFYRHNYEVLFESIRRTFSPRFQTQKQKAYESEEAGGKIRQSPSKKVGILIAKALSAIIALIEPVLAKGEIITVLAIKK